MSGSPESINAKLIQTFSDCCLSVCFDNAVAKLVLIDGDVDPFTGEEIGYPSPRVYWSNGAITDGGYLQTDE